MADDKNSDGPKEQVKPVEQAKPAPKENQNSNGKVIEIEIKHKTLQGIVHCVLTWSNKKKENIGLSMRNVQYHLERGAKLTGKTKVYVPGPSTL